VRNVTCRNLLKRDNFASGASTMARETPEELEARGFFESLGYVVERLSESSDSQRADYSVENGVDHLIVEVKSRGRDDEFEKRLERYGRAQSQATVRRNNPLSKQITGAARQIAATAAEDLSLLRVIVLVTAGDQPELPVDQFEATLYGKVYLLRADGAGVLAVPCFYFTFSDFFRLPDIDAAVVLARGGARQCTNSFARQRERLRSSKLHRGLSLAGAVTDPETQERLGKAFLADTDIDRADERAMLSFVRSKYGHPELLTFVPTIFRAAVVRQP
jgi:hypothetical protein